MSITGPFEFRLYSMDDVDVKKILEAGLTPPRLIFNDGSVPVSGLVDGERRSVVTVRSMIDRKRSTPYDAPDEARDEFAAFVAAALNNRTAP